MSCIPNIVSLSLEFLWNHPAYVNSPNACIDLLFSPIDLSLLICFLAQPEESQRREEQCQYFLAPTVGSSGINKSQREWPVGPECCVHLATVKNCWKEDV